MITAGVLGVVVALAAPPTPEAFAKIAIGRDQPEAVESALGAPFRTYAAFAAPGEKPLLVPYRRPDELLSPGPLSFWEAEREKKTGGTPTPAATPEAEDTLTVMEYLSDTSQSYYVVFRDDVVDYTIGPVPKDLRDPEAVAKKYGAATIRVQEARFGDVVRIVEMHEYPTQGLVFLKESWSQEFQAIARGALEMAKDEKKPKKGKKSKKGKGK